MNIYSTIITSTIAAGCFMAANLQAEETTYSETEFNQASIVVSGDNTATFSHNVEDTFTKFHSSSVSVTNGGTVKFNNLAVFDEASKLSVDASSSMEAGTISLYNQGTSFSNEADISMGYLIVQEGASAVNYGTITDSTPNVDWDWSLSDEENFAAMENADNLLEVISKGSFTNYGTIDSVTTVLDGEFIAQKNSSMGALCLGMWYEDNVDTMSTLKVNGSVSMTGLLESYSYSEIIFTMDATIDMQGNGILFDGGKIVLLYDGELTDSTEVYKKDFFVNYTIDSGNEDFGEDMVVTVIGTNNVSREMTVKELSTTVPEPTTATLSLLALAGLAARRRRR